METKCGVCGTPLESFDAIHVAGQGPHCYSCFNREAAEQLGVQFDEPRFRPIVLTDVDGIEHTFNVRSMLVPTGYKMEAFETAGHGTTGYYFAVLDVFDADPWELLQRLYGKMRREIAIRHVHRTEFGWQLTSEQQLVGRIEWDSNNDGRVPIVVIDGKAFTWEQVGHMLMTFEGFTLEARISDAIEIVGNSHQTSS